MTHYSATSLEQIADELERLGDEATAANHSDDVHADQAYAAGLREAATLVRNTRLADPAMEAMVKALEAAHKFIAYLKKNGAEQFGEGVHVGLRKGTDAPDSHTLWTAISNSRTSAWHDAMVYALDPFFSMWGGDKALDALEAALKLAKDNGHV